MFLFFFYRNYMCYVNISWETDHTIIKQSNIGYVMNKNSIWQESQLIPYSSLSPSLTDSIEIPLQNIKLHFGRNNCAIKRRLQKQLAWYRSSPWILHYTYIQKRLLIFSKIKIYAPIIYHNCNCGINPPCSRHATHWVY